jgi:hypothetical protein
LLKIFISYCLENIRKYLLDIQTINSTTKSFYKEKNNKVSLVSSFIAEEANKPFKEIQREKSLRDDQVIQYYFTKLK